MSQELKPELRFPEFHGDWTTKNLGDPDVATFYKGKGISKNDIVEDGETPCIRYGELYTEYNEVIDEVKSRTNVSEDELVLSEEYDVIIPASGETVIDIATASCVLKPDIALGGDLNIIRTNTLNGVFLAYYLNNSKKKSIARLAQGISVIHLYKNHLKSLNLNIPEPDEQQKIANFLKAIDKRIKLLKAKKEALEDYKTSIMQKLFAQEIRFKQDDGSDFPEWEPYKLGDLGSTLNGLTGKTKVDFGEGQPYIQYMQIFKNSKIDISDFGYVNITPDDNQTKIKYGDILFTTSSETREEVGTSSVMLEQIDNLYLNSFSFGFRLVSFEILMPEFARYLFKSYDVRKMVVRLGQGSTRYNMSKVAFMKDSITLPAKEEQVKIASILSNADEKINRISESIDVLTDFKQSLLQKMFV
jgi:type I restriction enzyme S subunit